MTDKVVSFFKKKEELEEKKEGEETPKAEEASEEDFAAIAERNRQNAERMKKERLKANKSVLRSYRIKP